MRPDLEQNAGLTPKRYVMVVDSGGGPLCALSPRLRELRFRVVTVPNVADASDLARSFPKLALVAVNEGIDPSGSRRLLTTLRETQPDLPVLWHGSAAGLARPRSEFRLSEQPKAEELRARADEVLGLDGYPPALVAVLSEASIAALSGFGAHCCARDPFLRASRTDLAELCALIAFSGPASSGHLIVGASREVARRAYAATLSTRAEPTDEQLADLLGEVCNRIMGPLMQELAPECAVTTFGLPLFITGQNGQIWEKHPRPSLGLEFEGGVGPVFVEFCGSGLKLARPPTQLPSDLLKSGDFILL